MEKVAIISIMYKEPEWDDTETCIMGCKVPIFFVDRGGTRSLAKALNAGFNQWVVGSTGSIGFQYIWFITNVLFQPDLLGKLLDQMDKTGFAGITPAFHSDHLFCRPEENLVDRTDEVPFIEFTAPIVRSDVFKHLQLDEDMPYWGHDLDWGHRVRQAGFKVGCFKGGVLGHTYIRNDQAHHPVTVARAQLRQQTNNSTRKALENKYGKNWREVLRWY